jgi:hypothetical protein
MRTALGLLIWLTLAAIGATSAGFWGFLGVAFLYVLYYGLLRPRVMVHVTPQELEASSLALLKLGGGKQRTTRPLSRRQRTWS